VNYTLGDGLAARESRILESESFLPLVRQLQEMKLALEDALPWIETIREKAEAENVDIRTTAINVSQELRLYHQSEGNSIKMLLWTWEALFQSCFILNTDI